MNMFFYYQESGEVIAKLEKKFDEVSKVPIAFVWSSLYLSYYWVWILSYGT